MQNKILPSITTTNNNDWRARIKEINELGGGIEEIALFPTCLKEKERWEMYEEIQKLDIKSIPYCHLRNDMTLEELDYLVKKFNIRVFSTHMAVEFPISQDWAKYNKVIFIESVYHHLDEEELKKFGGICLDFGHMENDRILFREKFKHNLKMLEKYPIGCNHIGAIKKISRIDDMGEVRYNYHKLDELSEMDYLKSYPEKYFSQFCAIELENTIREQLKVKEYIINLLNKKGDGTIFSQ